MKKIVIGVAAAALAAGGVAVAQNAPHAGKWMMKTETRAEVAGHVQRMFARLDTNRDGFITKAEAEAIRAERAQKMEKRAARFDPAKVFARLDANHDGQITQAEADAVRAARTQAKGGQQPANRAHAGGMFARADANKDGVVTRAEFDAAATQRHARMEKAGMHRGFAGRMFDLADSNKDGKVSLAEAQAVALAHFDRADLNHDGQLTPQERQQFHQQMRAQRKPS
jgi:hypothetical protein